MTDPAPAVQARSSPRQRALLGTSFILLFVGTLAFFGPQHRVTDKQLNWCWAPDCKSSVSTSTRVCGGLARMEKDAFPDAGIPIVFAIILVLQVLAFLLRSRGPHIAAGITTMLCAFFGFVLVMTHEIGEHLFDQTEILWGEALLLAVLLGLFTTGIVQLALLPAARRV